MLRILLFLGTNIAVLIVISVVFSLFGLDDVVRANGGMNLGSLLVMAAIIGFSGSLISLFLSKSMAKRSMGVQVIEQPGTPFELWLVDTVARQAQRSGITMPEVGIFDSPDPNAFATGWNRNAALVAVSTGLLQTMTKDEVEAVVGHEITHVANGDMVTLALIQGVVNTFVVFLSRVVAYFVDGMLRKDGEENRGPGIGYMVTVFVCDLLFGLLASMIVMYFSRQREYRADAGAARLLGTPQPMIAALQRLGGLSPEPLPQNMASSGIAGGTGALFASHPSMEERIAALRGR